MITARMPDYLFVATNTRAWDGYELIQGVDGETGGMYQKLRHLFAKSAHSLPTRRANFAVHR